MSTQPVKQPLQAITSFSLPSSAYRNMAWKEFRQNLPLFIAFVCIMAITLTIASIDRYAYVARTRASNEAFWYIIIVAYMNFFSLTIGVFLFAPEKENKTARMLSHLPITSGFAVRAKIWNGLIAIGAFAVVAFICLTIENVVFQASMNSIYGQEDFLFSAAVAIYAGVLLPLECFFWGVICSLTIKRTIFAAIAAAGCVLLFAWIIPGLVAASIGYQAPNTELKAWTVLCSVKVLILLIAYFGFHRQSLKWLGNSPQRKMRRSAINGPHAWILPANSLAKASPQLAPRSATTRIRIYKSLIWQSFRQNRSTLFWAIGLGAPFLAFAFLFAPEPDVLWAISIGCSLIVLFGSMFVFSKDHQDGNYRFFQQHVEHGRKFWFSRLLPSALLAGICFLAFCLCSLFLGWRIGDSNVPTFFGIEYIGWYAVFSLAIFSIGQFNSMMYRSGVFSFAATVVMICVTVAWMFWLSDFEANLWLYFAPAPIALLMITWWRAPHWLADRNRIRDHLIPHAAAFLVAVATFGAFANQRYGEFPRVQLSLSAEKDTYASLDRKRPVEFQGAILIRDAAQSMVLMPESNEFGSFQVPAAMALLKTTEPMKDADKFLNANQYSLDLVNLAFDSNNGKPLLDPQSIASRVEQVKKIRFLISIAAQQAESCGDLKLALDHWTWLLQFDDMYPVNHDQVSAVECLMRWSDHPEQTPKLLKQAIGELNYSPSQWYQRADNATYFNQLDFENWYLELNNKGVGQRGLPHNVTFSSGRFLGFAEMERSRRITQFSICPTNRKFWDVLAEVATEPDATIGQERGPSFQGKIWRMLGVQIPEFQQGNPRQTPFRSTGELFHVDGYGDWQEVVEIVQSIQERRYAQVRMALNGSRLENGSYPIDLQKLVPEYFQVLPKDVVDGGDFEYAPKGYDRRISWTGQQQRISPNIPFLLPWSVQTEKQERPIENGSQYTGVLAVNFSDRQNLVCRNWFHFPFELKESTQPGTPEGKQQD